MSLTVTAWRLTDKRGTPNRCMVSQQGERWQLIVTHNEQVVVTEPCPTDDVALRRADEIWRVLVRTGWQDPTRLDSDAPIPRQDPLLPVLIPSTPF